MSEIRTKLKSIGLTHASLARGIGVSQSYISEVVSGKKSPSLGVALAIEDLTEGQITARMLHDASPKARPWSE